MIARTETIGDPAGSTVHDLDRRLERELRDAGAQITEALSFVLASASPRRRDLLAALGLRFAVDAADIPEIPQAGESPEEFARRAAADKAVYVAARHPGRLTLGADTVVALGGDILGKPLDRDDARRMLERLSGANHRVCTAIALTIPGAAPDVAVVVSDVAFRPMTGVEIDAYIDSGDPFDKAGAYGIQSGAGRFVDSVRGSYSNVIGLPLVETIALLTRRRQRK